MKYISVHNFVSEAFEDELVCEQCDLGFFSLLLPRYNCSISKATGSLLENGKWHRSTSRQQTSEKVKLPKERERERREEGCTVCGESCVSGLVGTCTTEATQLLRQVSGTWANLSSLRKGNSCKVLLFATALDYRFATRPTSWTPDAYSIDSMHPFHNCP